MQLITLRAAAIRLGVSEPFARRLLADYAVYLGSRKRYPIEAVERLATRGTR